MNRLLKNRIKQAKKYQNTSSKLFIPNNFLWTLHPISRTLHWIGAIIIGATASLYSDKILNFTYPWNETAGSINWPSIIFFLSVITLTVLFALHDWVKRAQDNYAIDSMLTMPPRDFWISYGENYSELSKQNEANYLLLEEALKKSQGNKSLDNLNRALDEAKKEVRIGLDQIIRLAKKWDSANLNNANITYRANIMRVFYFQGDDDDTTLKVGSNEYNKICEYATRFITSPADHNYSGFVVLSDNQYTTTTRSTLPEPDVEIKPIAFPFTLQTDNRSHLIKYNYPGASVAVATKSPSYVPDVKELPMMYKKQEKIENIRFEKRIYDNLESYYRDNEVAHSILSIPLVDNSHRIHYVLNVYRDQPELLYAGGKVADFSEIVRPYAAILENMMFTIQTYEKSREKVRPETSQ